MLPNLTASAAVTVKLDSCSMTQNLLILLFLPLSVYTQLLKSKPNLGTLL